MLNVPCAKNDGTPTSALLRIAVQEKSCERMRVRKIKLTWFAHFANLTLIYITHCIVLILTTARYSTQGCPILDWQYGQDPPEGAA
jgi:hypothetical protein